MNKPLVMFNQWHSCKLGDAAPCCRLPASSYRPPCTYHDKVTYKDHNKALHWKWKHPAQTSARKHLPGLTVLVPYSPWHVWPDPVLSRDGQSLSSKTKILPHSNRSPLTHQMSLPTMKLWTCVYSKLQTWQSTRKRVHNNFPGSDNMLCPDINNQRSEHEYFRYCIST